MTIAFAVVALGYEASEPPRGVAWIARIRTQQNGTYSDFLTDTNFFPFSRWKCGRRSSRNQRRNDRERYFLFLDRNVDEKAQENEDGTTDTNLLLFFGENANERAQEIDEGTTGCFLGGNMDDKAQENEDETIKSKKERLEGICERMSSCSVFFFLVSNKTVVKLYDYGSSALFREANARAFDFIKQRRCLQTRINSDEVPLFRKERRKRAIDLTRAMLHPLLLICPLFFSKTRRGVQLKQIKKSTSPPDQETLESSGWKRM